MSDYDSDDDDESTRAAASCSFPIREHRLLTFLQERPFRHLSRPFRHPGRALYSLDRGETGSQYRSYTTATVQTKKEALQQHRQELSTYRAAPDAAGEFRVSEPVGG
jgi:hypothetical protein